MSLLCGCYWLDGINLMKQFTSEYKHYLQNMLDEGLANCEEQVRSGRLVWCGAWIVWMLSVGCGLSNLLTVSYMYLTIIQFSQ